MKIAILCGSRSFALGQWDDTTVGLPGSEEAVVYLSARLVARGNSVSVFANPTSERVEKHNNKTVMYFHTDEAERTGDRFDVAICWRDVETTFLLSRRIAKRTFFWPHDLLSYGTAFLEQVDGILFLSEYQKVQHYQVQPALSSVPTALIGNGIVLKKEAPIIERDPLKCVWGSNYSRGLHLLLDIWPTIHSRFPKASLDLYYGWRHWNNMSDQEERVMRQKVADLRSMNVIDHGSVSHEELDMAYQRSSVWSYSCLISENFPITAIKAQHAGCIPCVIRSAGLYGTVKEPARFVIDRDRFPRYYNGFIDKESIKVPYTNLLLSCLEYVSNEANKEKVERERQEMKTWVEENNTWDNVAVRTLGAFETGLFLPRRSYHVPMIYDCSVAQRDVEQEHGESSESIFYHHSLCFVHVAPEVPEHGGSEHGNKAADAVSNNVRRALTLFLESDQQEDECIIVTEKVHLHNDFTCRWNEVINNVPASASLVMLSYNVNTWNLPWNGIDQSRNNLCQVMSNSIRDNFAFLIRRSLAQKWVSSSGPLDLCGTGTGTEDGSGARAGTVLACYPPLALPASLLRPGVGTTEWEEERHRQTVSWGVGRYGVEEQSV